LFIRDLKLENILYENSKEGKIKIKVADFGLAKDDKTFLETLCGFFFYFLFFFIYLIILL
jgi:serine/threonine protein kinase